MLIKPKLIKVGNNSLMVIIPSTICEKKSWIVGDNLLIELVGKVEK